MKARIIVMPKPSVLDPQGQAVTQALGGIGIADIKAVRQGKVFEVDLAPSDPARAKKTLNDMCEKLLANTVIETYRIDWIE